MRWRRLGWAGIEIEAASGESLVIDHLLDAGILENFKSAEHDEVLLAPEAGRACAALVTHLHRDHADPGAIEAALAADGVVLRPPPKPRETQLDEIATGEADAALAAANLDVRPCAPGEGHRLGPFAITALPASDGLGSPQVSWLIEVDGLRTLHAGDTLWHAGWWDVPRLYGPVDLAWLPGNGVEISYPGWEPPVEVPAVLTPEQAVEAAYALGAGTLVPIHFSRMFEHPDYYRPIADARARIEAAAARREVAVGFPATGKWQRAESPARAQA